MSKAVIFDFDGVIVDSFEMCLETNKLFIPEMTPEGYREKFEGNFFKKSNITKLDKTQFEYFDIYTEKLKGLKAIDGIRDFLEHLSSEYDLYIVTSSIKGAVLDFLRSNDIEYFKEVFGAEEAVSKVEKIEHILNEYNHSHADTVFITDTLGDIREAEEAKIDTIAVTWGFHEAERLQKGNPQAIVNNLFELHQEIVNELEYVQV